MTTGRIRFEEPMKAHTTFGIGGPAAGFLYPESRSELISLLKFARSENLPVYYVGSGSNLLVSDEGFEGIVISLAKTFKSLVVGANGSVYCEAGVMTGRFVKKIVGAGLSGVETLIGVPGTVGGALVMNAGAFGNEISEYLKQVRVLLPSGEEKVYEKRDLEFAYRESSFQGDELIISADFKFPAGDVSKIKNQKERASLKRKKYQPLRYRSAGSIFKNPPSFAAGYLIDRVGLKGVRSGDAMISEQHANFIVNLGHA
ncbi:MAG: UDP-N-acetylmuramate dehydrogenase, partial [FCB group bacterium]|nr:UDP-N-acetylmuramate dehydrogenase [FCB group bacterium]